MKWKLLLVAGIFCVLGGFLLWLHYFTKPNSASVVAACYQTVQSGKTQQLPITISDSNILLQRLCGYEGPYLEDGTGEYVADIAALVVKNMGNLTIRYFSVDLKTPAGEYCFSGSWLPPGNSCLVLESNRKPFLGEKITILDTCAQVDWSNEPWEDAVVISETPNDTVRVHNTSQHPMPQILIYYKTYYAQTDMYVGGITYHYLIDNLKSREMLDISLPNFASGYSKIVGIRTSKT